jgi:hypothetical protein
MQPDLQGGINSVDFTVKIRNLIFQDQITSNFYLKM